METMNRAEKEKEKKEKKKKKKKKKSNNKKEEEKSNTFAVELSVCAYLFRAPGTLRSILSALCLRPVSHGNY